MNKLNKLIKYPLYPPKPSWFEKIMVRTRFGSLLNVLSVDHSLQSLLMMITIEKLALVLNVGQQIGRDRLLTSKNKVID